MSDVFDLAVTGDILLGDHWIENGTIVVDKGKILLITHNIEGFKSRRRISAESKWILPGIVDSHVHALSYAGEGLANTTRAALAGGVTTIIDMPMDAPSGIATSEAFRKKIELIEAESFCDVALLGSVRNETIGNIPALASEGACGFKISLFDSDPERFPRVHDGHLLETFFTIQKTGLTAGVHAENDEIIKREIHKSISEGKIHPRAHCETRPEISETESVLKCLEMARTAGVRLHLYHLSCSRSIDLAGCYREEGSTVTVETCPHYLIFSEEDMDRLGGKLRINPPVRKSGEGNAIWDRISRSRVDCLSSDHAPWPLELKEKASIFDAACGAPGVETLFPILFSEGVVKKRISMSMLMKLTSENPAKIFGLFPRKGALIPGSDADMIILDPQNTWAIQAEKMYSKAGWTPYEGMGITGKVVMTIVRGEVAFEDDEITGEAGRGRFLRPFRS